MKPKEWVRVIRGKEFIFIFFDVLLLVLPGVGALFLYDNQAFMSLDWARIILLGAALMAPLVFLNLAILPGVFGEFDGKAKDDVFVLLAASILWTSLFVYATVAIFYVAGYSARFCAGALIGIETVLAVVAVIKDLRNKKKALPKGEPAARVEDRQGL